MENKLLRRAWLMVVMMVLGAGFIAGGIWQIDQENFVPDLFSYISNIPYNWLSPFLIIVGIFVLTYGCHQLYRICRILERH